NALWALEHDVPDDAPAFKDDWRVRFRRVPDLGDAVLPGQQSLYMSTHADPKLRVGGREHPLRPLEEILADDEIDVPEETCPDCGGVMESYTGLPACPETAVSTAVFQLKMLGDAREDGIEDLFELLDELEGDMQEHVDAGEPRGPKARERWRDELEELANCRETCLWLVEQGVEEVGQAKAMLLAEAGRLAAEFGDPEGLLTPVRTVRLAGPKIGRHDPCPGGPGRKDRHCCPDKAGAAARGPRGQATARRRIDDGHVRLRAAAARAGGPPAAPDARRLGPRVQRGRRGVAPPPLGQRPVGRHRRDGR